MQPDRRAVGLRLPGVVTKCLVNARPIDEKPTCSYNGLVGDIKVKPIFR